MMLRPTIHFVETFRDNILLPKLREEMYISRVDPRLFPPKEKWSNYYNSLRRTHFNKNSVDQALVWKLVRELKEREPDCNYRIFAKKCFRRFLQFFLIF